MRAVKRRFPHAGLQWEDFSRDRAFEVLERYAGELPSLNDDIQGTAAMAYAATLGALRLTGGEYRDQVFVVLGAGAAGAGVVAPAPTFTSVGARKAPRAIDPAATAIDRGETSMRP